MLSLRKPSAERLREFLEVQSKLDFSYPAEGATAAVPPVGYIVDRTQIKLGEGAGIFAPAKAALERWQHFHLGWVEAWPSETPIQAGQVVAVIARIFSLWWLNACRIVYVVNEDGPVKRYGFAYGTLPDGFLYYECEEFQVLHLPYKGRQLAMLVVLPRQKDGLSVLEARWAKPQTFREVANGLDPETVIVTLPRFKIEAEFRLKSLLCALHADLAFSDEADFSGIGVGPLKISEVVHKAFVEVNEEGTEAAAATAVVMMRSTGAGSRPPEPKVFKADHPFLFFIWDRKTNTVFFSGRLVDPK